MNVFDKQVSGVKRYQVPAGIRIHVNRISSEYCTETVVCNLELHVFT